MMDDTSLDDHYKWVIVKKGMHVADIQKVPNRQLLFTNFLTHQEQLLPLRLDLHQKGIMQQCIVKSKIYTKWYRNLVPMKISSLRQYIFR